MNTELIPIMVGFFVVYAWTLFVAGVDMMRLHKENAKLRAEISEAMQRIAMKNAAVEGDYETARLMAAVHRDMVKTKAPVSDPPSAGAKKEKELLEKLKEMTGVRITQSG